MTHSGWLLIFYMVPSKPVNNRIKLWRKLARAGAIPLKGAVYILPHSEEHYEFLQWVVSEVASMGGEGAFVRVDHIETMKDPEIITLFNKQREEEYSSIDKGLDDLERKLSSIKKGGRGQDVDVFSERIRRILKEYEEIKKVDFFSSGAGRALGSKIRNIDAEIRRLSGAHGKHVTPRNLAVSPKNPVDYQGKVWVTRKRPFVDRMASAWLIRRCIDRNAAFRFRDEKDMAGVGKTMISFDVRDGEFTHVGDMCTFEVLVKAFGIKDKVIRKIAGIVHELDIKDEKYSNPEAKGIEEILSGLKKTTGSDEELLEKGMAIFEMLYASKL